MLWDIATPHRAPHGRATMRGTMIAHYCIGPAQVVAERAMPMPTRRRANAKSTPDGSAALRRIGVWLDAWSMRGYGQDTHGWHAKTQVLHGVRAHSAPAGK